MKQEPRYDLTRDIFWIKHPNGDEYGFSRKQEAEDCLNEPDYDPFRYALRGPVYVLRAGGGSVIKKPKIEIARLIPGEINISISCSFSGNSPHEFCAQLEALIEQTLQCDRQRLTDAERLERIVQ